MDGASDVNTLRSGGSSTEPGALQEPSAEQCEEVLRRRAEHLARVPEVPPSDSFSAIVFRLGSERYAVPLTAVREVSRIEGITPVPGTPPCVGGLTTVRGRVITVLDVRPMLGRAPEEETLPYVLIFAEPNSDVGIEVTRPELRELRAGEVGPLHSGGIRGLDARCILGVTPDLIIVLDAAQVLAVLQAQIVGDT